MSPRYSVLIVTSDTLIGLGLKTLLTERFATAATWAVDWQDASPDHATSETVALVFCDEPALATVPAIFAGRKGRLVLLRESDEGHDRYRCLNVRADYDELVTILSSTLTDIRDGRMEASHKLTDREIDVLTLLARGLINKEIADRLGISTHTVISHRKNISAKLGIKSVSGLTVYATIHGYVEPDSVV